MKEWLFGKNPDQLRAIVGELGGQRFVAAQIADWIYKKHITDIGLMTNLSAAFRAKLAERYEVGCMTHTDVQVSVDGTKKYLFPTVGGQSIESAYIPDRERATLCVSSQAGCRMGCRFCMTGRQGFQHNLSAGEIVNQIRSLPDRDTLTNVVYMGMGEPLDNIDNVLASLDILTSEWGYAWSPTRITLSSIGVMPALSRFLTESKAHLAISLHNPFADERLKLMPAENKHTLDAALAEIRLHDFTHQRRVSFEYIMFEGVNDSPRHSAELVRQLSGLRCRVNLIRFHAIPDSPLTGSDERRMLAFQTALEQAGIITTIRKSRGEDIFAACGMLSTQAKGGEE